MKKLLVLSLICAGLAAFVYFYEIVGEEKREEARELEERLVRFEQDEINGLRISREGSPDIVVERDGEEWNLKEPLDTVADTETVNSLLRNLTDARRERTFENGAEAAEKYGLTDPPIRLVVRKDDEQKVLEIGNKDYTGNELYVMFEGEPQVYLTSALLLDAVDKGLMDWRDKSILSFDRDQVQEIRIKRTSEEVVLTKKGDHWFLTAPIEEPADESTVSSLLSTLENGKAQEFITEDAEDLSEFGLDNPAVTVRLREEGEDLWRQLELGSQLEETVFARNPLRPVVFTVEKDVFKDLFQELWEFRSKEVVDVDQDEIARLTIDRQGDKITVRHEDYKWILEVPKEQEGQEVLAYKFWYPIDDIKFESILDDSLDFPEPELRILVELRDGSRRSFEFASRGDTYLARQVESGRQGEISKDDFEKLDLEPEEMID